MTGHACRFCCVAAGRCPATASTAARLPSRCIPTSASPARSTRACPAPQRPRPRRMHPAGVARCPGSPIPIPTPRRRHRDRRRGDPAAGTAGPPASSGTNGPAPVGRGSRRAADDDRRPGAAAAAGPARSTHRTEVGPPTCPYPSPGYWPVGGRRISLRSPTGAPPRPAPRRRARRLARHQSTPGGPHHRAAHVPHLLEGGLAGHPVPTTVPPEADRGAPAAPRRGGPAGRRRGRYRPGLTSSMSAARSARARAARCCRESRRRAATRRTVPG